jgi:hypothetical protein
MAEKFVGGLVILGFLVMIFLAYAQRHEGCVRGRSLETFKPCGSIEHQI